MEHFENTDNLKNNDDYWLIKLARNLISHPQIEQYLNVRKNKPWFLRQEKAWQVLEQYLSGTVLGSPGKRTVAFNRSNQNHVAFVAMCEVKAREMVINLLKLKILP